jgi:hypothetical protein
MLVSVARRLLRPRILAAGAGALAVYTASRARCEPASSSQSRPRGPASAAAAAEAEASGDLTARNLDVNIARVEDWKAAIEGAKEAWSAGRRDEAETLLRSALDKASYFGAESPPVATSMHNLAEVRALGARGSGAARSCPPFRRVRPQSFCALAP